MNIIGLGNNNCEKKYYFKIIKSNNKKYKYISILIFYKYIVCLKCLSVHLFNKQYNKIKNKLVV